MGSENKQNKLSMLLCTAFKKMKISVINIWDKFW